MGKIKIKSLKVRTKIILITVAILFVAVGASNSISSWLFSQEYSDVLKSKLTVVAQILRSQLNQLLSFGIPLDQLVGFEEQCQEVLASFKGISFTRVVDPQGKILFHNDPAQHHKILTCRETLTAVKNGQETSHICAEYGEKIYIFSLPVHGPNGEYVASVNLGLPKRFITQKTKRLIAYDAGVAIFFLGLGIFLLVHGLSAWVTDPLKKLTNFIKEIREKGTTDFNQRVEIDSQDEFGQLGTIFNRMIDDLQQTTVSKDYVDNIISSMVDSLIVVNPEAKIRTVNKATCKLLGYNEEELIGAPANLVIKTEGRAFREGQLGKLIEEGQIREYETHYKRKDGRSIPILFSGSVVKDQKGHLIYIVCMGKDITERKRVEMEREKLLRELQKALSEIKKLSGLLPICSSCKKVRDDKGYWNQIETYIREHSEAEFSHGLCPDCVRKMYPDFSQ